MYKSATPKAAIWAFGLAVGVFALVLSSSADECDGLPRERSPNASGGCPHCYYLKGSRCLLASSTNPDEYRSIEEWWNKLMNQL